MCHVHFIIINLKSANIYVKVFSYNIGIFISIDSYSGYESIVFISYATRKRTTNTESFSKYITANDPGIIVFF